MGNSFDSGETVEAHQATITPEELAQRRQELTDQYNQQYVNLQNNIRKAQDILDQINNEIAQCKIDLADMYVRGNEKLEEEITLLTQQIEQRENQLLLLNNAIAEKEIQYQKIVSDIALAYANLAVDKKIVEQGQEANAFRKQDLDAREQTVKTIEQNIIQESLETQAGFDKRTTDLNNREATLQQKEVYVENVAEGNDKFNAEISAREVKLSDLEKELAQKYIDAKPYLDQADWVKGQLENIETQNQSLAAREVQVQKDSNQIRATQIAQAQKQNELNARQATIEAAEKTLAGGSK